MKLLARGFLPPLLLLAAAICPAAREIAAHAHASSGSIENPTCEQLGPTTYRIDFVSTSSLVPVQVFASSRPDSIDSAAPVTVLKYVPADVTIPARSGRVYFHLKAATGTRVVSVRRLPLQGAKNFRDLGGYRAADGRYVRWGQVYRSGYLADLTRPDYDYLNTLGIRLVCDVRTDGERHRSPTHWDGPPPEFLAAPIGGIRDGTMSPDDVKRRVAAFNVNATVSGYEFALNSSGQYGTIFHRIASGDLPIVEHCSAGKDRTGVFSAILLTVLGVPRDTILQDYLLSERYLLAPDSFETSRVQLTQILGLAEPLDDASVRAFLSVKPEVLQLTFASIDKTYGSFDAYLRDALKLSEADLMAIRSRLLEP